MEKKNILKTSAIATGALLVGSVSNVQAANLFDTQDLGSGAELRTQLLDLNNAVPSFINNNDIELKCGEGKCGEKSKKAEKKAEGKSAEHKCGEGKCGEKSKKAESKTSEHKCGEGKCGEKSKKAESKTSEHKCGEGKCGK